MAKGAASETWVCKCPRRLLAVISYCSRCNTGQPKGKK